MDLTCAHLRDICKQNNIKISKKGKKLNKKQLINLLKKQSGGGLLKCSNLTRFPTLCDKISRCIIGKSNGVNVCVKKQKCIDATYNNCSKCGLLTTNCYKTQRCKRGKNNCNICGIYKGDCNTAKKEEKKRQCESGNINNCEKCSNNNKNKCKKVQCETGKLYNCSECNNQESCKTKRNSILKNNIIEWKFNDINYHINGINMTVKKINFEDYAKIIYYLFPKLIKTNMEPFVKILLGGFPKDFIIAYLKENLSRKLEILNNNESSNNLPSTIYKYRIEIMEESYYFIDYLIFTSLNIYNQIISNALDSTVTLSKSDLDKIKITMRKLGYEDIDLKLTNNIINIFNEQLKKQHSLFNKLSNSFKNKYNYTNSEIILGSNLFVKMIQDAESQKLINT